MTAPRGLQRFLKRAALAPGVAVAFLACAEHEPEVERRGPPIPDADVTVPPPNCGGEGGAPAEPVQFCQAEIILRTVCQNCHSNPPMHEAPFPLVTYEDTQEVFDTTTGQLRWQRMQQVVETDLMPLRGVAGVPIELLTCEEKSTLMGWLEQCALPEGGTDCTNRNETLTGCDPRWTRE